MISSPVLLAGANDLHLWRSFFDRQTGVPPIGGPDWKAALQKAYGRDLECLIALGPDNEPTGILAFHMAADLRGRRRLFSAPWGLISDNSESASGLARAAAEIARDRGCVSAIINSGARYHPLPYRHNIKQTFMFDLLPTTEAIWSSLRSKTRNSIRRGQKSGLKVVRGWEALGDFFQVYSARMTDRTVPFHNLRYFQVLAETLGPRGEVFAALRAERVEAAMLVVYGGRIASYNWGAVNPGAESVQAGQFLLWEIVQACVSRGLNSLDLGESSEGSGTHAFKAKFGARPIDIHYYDLLNVKAAAATESAMPPASSPGLSTLGRAEKWIIRHMPTLARSQILQMQRRGTRLF